MNTNRTIVNLIKLNSIRSFSSSSKIQSKLPPSLNVFDRNTKLIQRNRTASMPDYKEYEYVKSEIGYRVADRVFDIKRSFDNILDLGCQRGYVSKHLTKVGPLNLTKLNSFKSSIIHF